MKPCFILFVEGATDEVLFKEIIRYYKNKYKVERKCYVKSFNGVSNYRKVAGCLNLDYLPRVKKEDYSLSYVLCSYDTDIFEFSCNPPIDWNRIKKEIKVVVGEKTIVKLIPVKSSIEDWLLSDLNGLGKFLSIKKLSKKSLRGRTGFDKIQDLFKSHGRVYFKGYESKNIVKILDIEMIVNEHDKDLKPLKEALGIEVKN